MRKLFSTRRGLILAGAVALVLVAIGVVLALVQSTRPFFLPYVVAVVVTVGLWFGLEAWLAARGRRKQAAFDAAVAAKEGIADRRREWDNWTQELRKQRIDRYELPFYLLVGEPQSGKSVLLQNSDLHFPFGQNRLSGIGGTRGCDWWFTEEAVILDLAGRLFTHEGGASDEAEWEAFLAMLTGFRPMCPANGVLLVLPCDGLLNDTAQQAAKKADRMQAALLTLTQRLQVQLPVYVVLTKGDKVFGFAETVHRLDTEQRQEMFGWSRPAEKVDSPFSIDEAREGFGGLLERCRMLRSNMLSTARIPEAIAEVDRLYGFPDEFAATAPNLEVYLRRIFTESSLVDRLYFRGFYLTSGLQTGAPIAKVCKELLGTVGEADARNLESLFTKQRAYFIKDLVRKRVFAERGVVRPTRSRMMAARRSAFLGYGLAGALVVAVIAMAITYMASSKDELKDLEGAADVAVAALKGGKSLDGTGTAGATDDSDLPALLTTLRVLRDASERKRPVLEHLLPFGMGSSKDDFEAAYVAVFDRTVPRALRRAAESTLESDVTDPPKSYAEYLQELGSATLLHQAIPWDDEDKLRRFQAISPQKSLAPGGTPDDPFDVVVATKLRSDWSDAPIPKMDPAEYGDAVALTRIRGVVASRIDDALDFRTEAHVDEELGKFVAFVQARAIHDRLVSGTQASGATAQEDGALYHKLMEALCGRDYTARGANAQTPVVDDSAEDDFKELSDARDAFLAASGKAVVKWEKAEEVATQFPKVFTTGAAAAPPKDAAGAIKAGIATAKKELKGVKYPLPPPHEVKAKKPEEASAFLDACAADVLPIEPMQVGTLPARMTKAGTTWLTEKLRDSQAGSVVYAKCYGLQEAWIKRFVPFQQQPAPELLCDALNAPKPPAFAPAVLHHLASLRVAISAIDPARYARWSAHVDTLIENYLKSVDPTFKSAYEQSAYVDPDAAWAFAKVRDPNVVDASKVAPAGKQLAPKYLQASYEPTLARWRSSSLDDPATAAEDFVKLKAQLDSIRTNYTQDILPPGHRNWVAALDDAVSACLQKHYARLLAVWEVEKDAFKSESIANAAKRAGELTETDAIEDRRQTIRAEKLQDAALDARQFEELEKGLKKTILVMRQVAALLEPPDAGSLSGSANANWLRGDFTQQVARTAPDDVAARGRLVDAWTKTPEELWKPAEDPSLDVPRYYLSSVVRALDQPLLRDFRGWFESDFKRGFLAPADRGVYTELFVAGKGVSASPSADSFNRVTEWLDRKGRLEELTRAHRLGVGERTIRPSAAELAALEDDARAPWDAYDFLDRLQRFLLAGGKTTIAKVELSYTLELEAVNEGTIWWPTGGGRTIVDWIGVAHRATAEPLWSTAIDASLRGSEQARTSIPLKWGLSPGADPTLVLAWNSAFRMPARNEAKPGGPYRLEYPGPLGLLSFVWDGAPADANAGGAAGTIWRVEADLPSAPAAGLKPFPAPFVVRFESTEALPPIPESLTAYWSR